MWSGGQCKAWSPNLESVVNVSFVDSPTNPLYTIVLLAGLPFGLTVASWKKEEYFSSLFSSRDLSKALRHGAAAVMIFCATFELNKVPAAREKVWSRGECVSQAL